MGDPYPLPDQFRKGAFLSSAAVAAGIHPERLRRRDLQHPFHGVVVPESVDLTLVERAHAAALLLPPGAHFSHITAARLHGMRVPGASHGEPLHVTASGMRALRGRGTRGHRTDRSISLVQLDGLPVPSAPEVWMSLAPTLTLPQLVVAGDGLVRRHRPLCTIAELREVVLGSTGRRGAIKARAALLQVRGGTDSAQESRLRLTLQRHGLPEPEVNGAIRNEHGVVIAHADLLYRPQRVALEYDGRHHMTDSRQWSIDVDRLDDVMELGHRVIRVTAETLAREATLVAKVRQALSRG